MDLIGEFTLRLYWELYPIFHWVLNNWGTSLLILLVAIFWLGHNRRTKHV
jgi:hypothetical protein